MEDDKEIYKRIAAKGFLRPFIRGYSKVNWLNEEHNHTIAVDQFRKCFKHENYVISPFVYPDGHGVRSPISFILRKINDGNDFKYIKVGRIIWKRHPEIYEFIFGKPK